jgi:hypothetical protein
MERLLVLATDEPATEPPGNSSHHKYEFFVVPAGYEVTTAADAFMKTTPVAQIQFQRGPFDTEGSTPGTLGAAVVAALIDHCQGFQAGPLATRENGLVITKLQEALFWMRERADDRARRGVLGTMGK